MSPALFLVPALALTAQGPLTKDSIAEVVHQHRKELRACQDAALLQRPSLSGRVTVAWTIELNGTVSAAAVKSSTAGDPTLEECLLAAVRTWRFPRPKHGKVQVAFPFSVGKPAPADAGVPAPGRRPLLPPPDPDED